MAAGVARVRLPGEGDSGPGVNCNDLLTCKITIERILHLSKVIKVVPYITDTLCSIFFSIYIFGGINRKFVPSSVTEVILSLEVSH